MRRSAEVKKQETEQLVAIVVARYVATGKDLTVPEIAEQLKWSETKVRRAMNVNGGGGCPSALQMRQEERPSYSKNYRNTQSGVHKIWVYGPTRETLRAQIQFQLALRMARCARCGEFALLTELHRVRERDICDNCIDAEMTGDES